jgi:phospholipid/cholesterol/gamma-HCH transport system substrate-binding protein
MISRKIKLQVLVFAIISALGVTFVGVRYVGLGDAIVGDGYTVHADFEQSGGIFTNAAVTYRGVQVGRVGDLHLRPGGVRVDLELDGEVDVPASTRAVVTNRSAVGEQYVDLRPDTRRGPMLEDGSVIPRSRTSGPLAVETLLLNLDKLVNSVDKQDLKIVIDELGRAFDGTGPSLQTMLDSGDALLAEADASLPETVALIRDGRTVLDTQVASGTAIQSWAKSLASLSDQLRKSDPDLRRLLANGPVATTEVVALLSELRPSFGFLLGNLIVVGQLQGRRINGLEQILATYPAVVAGSFTVVPGDGTAHFGLVLNVDDPPPCVYAKSHPLTCSNAEMSRGTSVRGERNAPRAGEEPGPRPLGSNDAAGSQPLGPNDAAGSQLGPNAAGSQPPAQSQTVDPFTGLALGPDGKPVQLGSTGGQQAVLGDQSWKALLLGPLAG